MVIINASNSASTPDSHMPSSLKNIGKISTDATWNISVICPKELCCNTIVRYVRAMQNQTGAAVAVHSIADGQAEAVEFQADSSTLHCDEPLKNIKLKPNVLIACITHGANTEIPSGDSSFSAGDTLIIVTRAGNVIHQLNDIFERG